MKNLKKTIFLISLLSAIILLLSFFLLKENTLNNDTARMNNTLDKMILAGNPSAVASDSLRVLPKNTQSASVDVIKNGAAYSRQVGKNQMTITKAFYENSQIQGFLALTEDRTNTSGPIWLMFVTVLIFYASLLILLVRKNKAITEVAVQPTVSSGRTSNETENPYEFTEFFNFPIFIFDDHGKIRYGNKVFVQEFPLHSDISQFSEQLDFLNFLLKGMLEPSRNQAEKLIHFEGISSDYETQFLMIENSRFLVMLRDVTVYQNALQAQKELVANVSHELKTPLTSIRGLADLLENNPEINADKRHEFVKLIAAESDRLLELVTDILILSQANSDYVQKTMVNLKMLIEQVMSHFQTEIERKKLDVEIDFVDVSMIGNEKKLRAIFKNLIENAVFYCNLNGRITMSLQQDNKGIHFTISNTGQGLSEVEKSRIFDRFYRAGDASRMNPKGTGLGLSIVKKNLLELGGKITVDSIVGRETSFHVTFTR